MTLLEQAAEVRAIRAELKRTCEELKLVGGDWTQYATAAGDAEKIADDGVRNAWAMLDRLNQLAKADLRRITTPNAKLTG